MWIDRVRLIIFTLFACALSCGEPPTSDDCMDGETTVIVVPNIDDGLMSPRHVGVVYVPLVIHINERHAIEGFDYDRLDQLVATANKFVAKYKLGVYVDDVVLDEYDEFIVRYDEDDQLSKLVEYNVERWADRRLHVYTVEWLYDERDGKTYGGYFWIVDTRCDGAILVRMDANEKVLTHEIGHALGLAHTDDETNMMWPYNLENAKGFTDEQGMTMHDVAEDLSCSCWS